MKRTKPPGLSWREDGTAITLAPHWGHSAGAGLVLVVSLTIIIAILIQPATGPEPRLTWGLGALIVSAEFLMVLWFTYPWWGKTRMSFASGVFRLGKSVALTYAELDTFTVQPTRAGVNVFAVKTDGTRVELVLPLGNPLTVEGDKSTASARRNANHHRAEGEYVAERLTELLEEARRDEAAAYRE